MEELWDNSWLWALPLIVLTVMLHVVVLGGINARVVLALQRLRSHRRFLLLFVVVMGITTMLATLLHGAEALDLGVRLSRAARAPGRQDRHRVLPRRHLQPMGTPTCIWRPTGVSWAHWKP